ncbi:MAG: prephenate dehydrogenase/arogenate dehydrogenase family protein [Acidobacteria bacterium]|nr:prephenate dehydrogenase/arogenate dehydrogenase family protein [Acidobacteriota bacterium]
MSRTLHLIQPRRAAHSAAIFDKIAVVGLGVVGGSVALAAREAWPQALVIGVDGNEVLEQAMLRHAVDVASHDLTILGDAGLVILARSEAENLESLRELPRHLEGPAVITDTGCTKRAIDEAAKGLPRRLTFVGGHPLVEPREGGIESARSDLFAGRHWILTPPDPPNEPAFDRLWAVATALGAIPGSMAAADHDRLFALLSHLPGVTLAGLLATVSRSVGVDDLQFVESPLSDLVRLAPQPAGRWRGVCRTNTQELGDALDTLIGILQECRAHLADDAWLERFFEAALALRHKASSAN